MRKLKAGCFLMLETVLWLVAALVFLALFIVYLSSGVILKAIKWISAVLKACFWILLALLVLLVLWLWLGALWCLDRLLILIQQFLFFMGTAIMGLENE